VTRAAVVLAVVVAGCESTPDAPVAIAYDVQACDECHMQIADRRYAAELATDDGVLFFDDPGCLLHYVTTHRPVVRHAWLRDSHADAWLARDEVAFADGARTPMGYGLAAVPRGTPGALGWDEASQRVARGAQAPVGGP
jgi:hypothetical protein